MDRKTISLSLDDLEDLITAIDDSMEATEEQYSATDDDELLDYIERLEWLRMKLQRVQSATA